MKCPSDKSVYDTYIDTYGRLKATAFFNSHNWLTEGTMIDFEIDTDSKIVKINIDTENTNADEIFSEQELTPDLERIVRDFLADSIIKGKIDSLRLYNGIQGVEYNTKNAGKIDLLCVNKLGDFVVLEIKRDSTSDKVVGQIQRYMGWVKENLAENKNVYGIIIMRKQDDDDPQFINLKYAIKANPNISLKFYQMSINLLEE